MCEALATNEKGKEVEKREEEKERETAWTPKQNQGQTMQLEHIKKDNRIQQRDNEERCTDNGNPKRKQCSCLFNVTS